LNSYPLGFIDSVINLEGSNLPSKEVKPLGSLCIPYVKGVSEKFKHKRNRYNIRMIIRKKHTLRSSLIRTRPGRGPQQMAQCVYSIPCECGRSYISETVKPLAQQLCEKRHNLKYGLLENCRLVQNAHEEGHRVIWDEAWILEIESNSRHRKYKESSIWCV
jgi:hypothetical protein